LGCAAEPALNGWPAYLPAVLPCCPIISVHRHRKIGLFLRDDEPQKAQNRHSGLKTAIVPEKPNDFSGTTIKIW